MSLIKDETLTKVLATAMMEIIDDISRGVVPVNVKSFDELHEYVDANEYGLSGVEIDDFDEWVELANKFHPILDQWIKSGMNIEEK